MDGDRARRRAEAAGERLDVFLAAHAGSRAAAQRLIDAGRVRVDGERARQAPRARAAASASTVAAAPAGAGGADGARRARSRSPTRTSTCSWSTSPPAWSCTRRAATQQGTLAQALARPARPAARPERARASCTGSTATPPGCWSSRAPRRSHAALQAQLSAREIEREYLALVEGRPAARARARSTRRSAATGACARGCRPTPTSRARRSRTSPSSARCAGHAAAGAARDRPHAPDPRAPAGDRPPGGRRPRVRPRRACRARAPVPARRAAGLRRTR